MIQLPSLTEMETIAWFVHQLRSQPAWLLLPFAIGFFSLSRLLLSFSAWLYAAFLRSPKNLLHYGSWALVTGSTDGIGRSLAFQLAKRGLHLVLVGRSPKKLEVVAAEILARFGGHTQVRTVEVDLAGDDLAVAGVGRIREAVEGLEVGFLINCAGVGDVALRRFGKVDEKSVRRQVRVNVEATMRVTQAVLKGMLERKRGAIVNIGSGASVVRPTLPLFAVYAATKAYINQFSRCLYVEYRKKGIDVQCQIPLFVATKMVPYKRLSFFTPSPDAYAEASVRWIGYEPLCMPYWTHYIQWCASSLLPDIPSIGWRLRFGTGVGKNITKVCNKEQ